MKAVNNLYGAAASRVIDANAMSMLQVSGFDLMQRAATAVFDSLLAHCPHVAQVAVVCGKGNNAGDGYLVAQRAVEFGLNCDVFAVVAPDTLTADAALAYQAAIDAGVNVQSFTESSLASNYDVIVDGLLGTGLSGPPRAPFLAAIRAINAAQSFVLSIDLPSGVSADTGAVFSCAVYADVCVSLITAKFGLHSGPGKSHVQTLEFAHLGVPRQAYTEPGIPLLHWSVDDLDMLDVNAYKHRQGHVVIVGGDLNMPGSVMMASEAALRVGAGMVTVLTRAEHVNTVVSRTPEAMVLGFDPEYDRSQQKARALLASASIVICGPGLGRDNWGQALYELVQSQNAPTVLDADGLYWLAQSGVWGGGPLLITPHTAEAARLLGQDSSDIQLDRPAAARSLAHRYHCAGVLKGAGSLLFEQRASQPADASLAVCGHGNPGMATAGMGDVLSGIIGGLWATALSDNKASLDVRYGALAQGVTLHSAAADRAARKLGQRSLLATDVIGTLPECLLPVPDTAP